MTDARVLAKHMEWAATSEAGRNQAFNVVNGDIFRWRWLWPNLAADFGGLPTRMFSSIRIAPADSITSRTPCSASCST